MNKINHNKYLQIILLKGPETASPWLVFILELNLQDEFFHAKEYSFFMPIIPHVRKMYLICINKWDPVN